MGHSMSRATPRSSQFLNKLKIKGRFLALGIRIENEMKIDFVLIDYLMQSLNESVSFKTNLFLEQLLET